MRRVQDLEEGGRCVIRGEGADALGFEPWFVGLCGILVYLAANREPEFDVRDNQFFCCLLECQSLLTYFASQDYDVEFRRRLELFAYVAA